MLDLHKFFVILLSISVFSKFGKAAPDGEGSGFDEESDSQDKWLEHVLNNYTNPHYLLQQVYFTLGETKPSVDNDEIITLEKSYPEVMEEEFKQKIIVNDGSKTLRERIQNLQKIVFYAFKPFGCSQENFWPSYYMISEENLQCMAENLIEEIAHYSTFTRKYFARAVHFGLNSRAPIEHRISEISIYQFLLPKREHAWFKNLKDKFKNTFWNEQELHRQEPYETNSFNCGSFLFLPEIETKIHEL